MDGASKTLGRTDRIGAGVQYSVYQAGPGRVLKIPNSPDQAEEIIKQWGMGPKPGAALRAYVDLVIRDRGLSVDFVQSRPELAAMFGNPVFEGGKYTQERVITLQEWFVTGRPDDVKKALDDYFKLTHEQWRHGFADKAYNFASGYGIGVSGRLIMIDFGELTTDINAARRDVKAKAWLHRRSYLELLPDRYKPYFKQKSDGWLTVHRLAEQWPD